MLWAAPQISTVKAIRTAAAGSPAPTGPDTPVGEAGVVRVSSTDPCPGDSLRVTADGFAPGTGVAIQIDSAAHAIGMTNADAAGAVDVVVVLPADVPTGTRTLRVVGVQAGGHTRIVTRGLVIPTAAECAAGVTPISGQGTPASPGSGASGGGLSLPFTGGQTTELTIAGGAAVIGGRLLSGLAKPGREDLDGTGD